MIHTSGPFQSQDYKVAKACIEIRAHYIDLADGREFVAHIDSLDEKAKQANSLVISGASSVPCFTSALVDYYRTEFATIEELDYGISTAQKTTRGLATTSAILGYAGKSFNTLIQSKITPIYGLQSLHAHKYPDLGWRLLGNCDVPDLELFPKRYPELRTIRFYAGLELPFLQLILWVLSWLVRARLIKNLAPAAPLLLRLSFLFDWLGSANSAFHMTLKGKKKITNQPKTIEFNLTARRADGPFIPSMPAILLAKKLAAGEIKERGAMPCIGLVSKEEYLDALSELDITWAERTTD